MTEPAALLRSNKGWQREVGIAAGLLAFGLLGLPFAIYVVGDQVLGDYAGSGALGLAESVWLDLAAFYPSAWLLVLSPYIVVQLARGVFRVWRRRPSL
jgi:hypothetical protein